MSDDAVIDVAKETRRIDLDAARAARAEKRGPAPVVVLDGKEYELPPELPGHVVTAFGMAMKGEVDSLEAAVRDLFGEHYEEISKARLSFDDQMVLLEGALAAYDFELPESSASGGSSSSTSRRSRRTSKGSTRST